MPPYPDAERYAVKQNHDHDILHARSLARWTTKPHHPYQAPIVYMPLLRAEGTNKLLIVGDHDDTTLVVTNGNCKTTERVAIQEVSRFVEHKQVRVVPGHQISMNDFSL
ncbi:hypothetical protein AC578_1811 [Pseudocercospora eumusae]|uniref:Uncharacterized protein n=1 Tax=Pseudocercospora eumusae TaxID=321146 RepID=A0A139HKH1_9PEZI|nr:hypothetical protein AC578_1811 [Pseudocercospora eumusae]